MAKDPDETIKIGGGLKSSGIVEGDFGNLEFKDDFKNKVKLREGGLGEPPSSKEIERFLQVKERLKSLLEDKRKQKGLVYRLGLKKKNSNIDQEIRETGEEYHQLLTGVKMKTGYSDEEIREYIEGGRAKKVEIALVRFEKEAEEAKERLGPGKKELFVSLEVLTKDKRVQFLLGSALTGTAFVTPPSGFLGILTLGLNPEYLPFDLGPTTKGTLRGGGFLLRDVLRERREKRMEGLKTVKMSFKGTEDLTEAEADLRNFKIEKVKEEKKQPEKKLTREQLLGKLGFDKKEEAIKKEEPAVLKEVVVKEVEKPVLPEEIEEPVVEEAQVPAVKEKEVVVKEVEKPVLPEEIEEPAVEEVPEKKVSVKKVKVPAVEEEISSELSLSQMQELVEELLTGKPPRKEKDKNK